MQGQILRWSVRQAGRLVGRLAINVDGGQEYEKTALWVLLLFLLLVLAVLPNNCSQTHSITINWNHRRLSNSP